MSQTLIYTVMVQIDNTRGIGFNADQIAQQIIGWNCSPECEGTSDFDRVTVTHPEANVLVEWAAFGGKVTP